MRQEKYLSAKEKKWLAQWEALHAPKPKAPRKKPVRKNGKVTTYRLEDLKED